MSVEPVPPPVHIVVLNYNGSDHLPYCLESICATDYPNLTILVVDNASTDGSLAAASTYPVRTLRSTRNLGWSGGNNLGIREALRAGAGYIVLANNDIRVHPKWIAAAVQVAETSPDVAVIGFDVHEPQPGDSDRDAGYLVACQTWSSTKTRSAEYVGGMAMFVRRTAFEELGLIDENLFAYGEENDFQIRVRAAGYAVLSVNVPVWHHGGASFGKLPFRASLLQTENNIQLILKHGGLYESIRAAARHMRRVWARSKDAVTSTAVERRLRSGSRLLMTMILPLAFVRILLKSPAIFRRRAEDRRLIAAAQARRVARAVVSDGNDA